MLRFFRLIDAVVRWVERWMVRMGEFWEYNSSTSHSFVTVDVLVH